MFAASKTAAVASAANYIEDVFSTYLYNGASNTALQIQNGIDLSTKGGMVWIKCRSNAVNHYVLDTARGVTSSIQTNATNAAAATPRLGTFNTDGFTHSATPTNSNLDINETSRTFASWTFRKQAKFFDVVTYTGNNASNRAISHNLGSTPGFILVKATSTTGDWYALHRVGNSGSWGVGTLNSTGAFNAPSPSFWGNGTTFTAPTSTTFTVSADGGGLTNGNGISFVAYLFAHDAGGFGASGTDNVISCGSFTTDGGSSFTAVNLGYEPQWLLIKASSGTSNWTIVDNMRGIPVGSNGARLIANLSDAETSTFSWANLTATGFGPPTGGTNPYATNTTYIYIAIRRGPMRTPTSGTSVFYPTTYTAPALNATATVTTGFPVDSVWVGVKDAIAGKTLVQDRLRISNNTTTSNSLETDNTASETSINGYATFNIANNTGYTLVDSNGSWGGKSNTPVWTPYSWSFRRAPGFFDVVCYTGDSGAATERSHNLATTPELIIMKMRNSTGGWIVWRTATGTGNTWGLLLNTTAAEANQGAPLMSALPTSTTFKPALYNPINGAGNTYVAYLFATLAGVSKVGSYTGTGTTLQIDCGFAAGARFVLIKRTDSTGDWYVWDSARGIVAGNDPYLLLNSSAAEVTNTDYVDTYSAGFEISSTAPAAINANGGTFIFLAIS